MRVLPLNPDVERGEASASTFSRELDVERASYVHPSAFLYGAVTLADGSSVWPNVVMRAEIHAIEIGRFTNIQDFVMIHVGYDRGVRIGEHCSVTHRVTLHGCTIEDHCLIGIGATVMDGCQIGHGSIVAGHAFLREGTIVPPGSIVMGAPAQVAKHRDCTRRNILNALLYHRNALGYARADYRAWDTLEMASLKAEAEAIANTALGLR